MANNRPLTFMQKYLKNTKNGEIFPWNKWLAAKAGMEEYTPEEEKEEIIQVRKPIVQAIILEDTKIEVKPVHIEETVDEPRPNKKGNKRQTS